MRANPRVAVSFAASPLAVAACALPPKKDQFRRLGLMLSGRDYFYCLVFDRPNYHFQGRIKPITSVYACEHTHNL